MERISRAPAFRLRVGKIPAIRQRRIGSDQPNLRPDLAFNIILPIFAAAVVGGLGNAYGAIAGGLLIGFAEALESLQSSETSASH